jgi:hypothetical protein
MLIPCVLLYALAKLFILKSNENYWLNTLLFILLSFILFSILMSLTWGLSFSKENSIIKLILGFGHFFLFPFILIQLKKIIKPVNDLQEDSNTAEAIL